jgi:hypothetical protein
VKNNTIPRRAATATLRSNSCDDDLILVKARRPSRRWAFLLEFKQRLVAPVWFEFQRSLSRFLLAFVATTFSFRPFRSSNASFQRGYRHRP